MTRKLLVAISLLVIVLSCEKSETESDNQLSIYEKAKVPGVDYNRALFKITIDYKDGFIDKSGNVVIQPESHYGDFFFGLARKIYSTNRFVYINESGTKVLPTGDLTYTYGCDFNYEGLAYITQNYLTKPQLIDKAGNHKFENITYEYLGRPSDGMVAVQGTNLKWGYVDYSGAVKVDFLYHDAGEFNEGYALVENDNNELLIIDKIGTPVATLPSMNASRFFINGLIYFNEGGSSGFGYINTAGEIAISPTFMDAKPHYEGYAAVLTEYEKWGFIDTNGNMIIEPQFAGVNQGFSEGLAPVAKKIDGVKKWGYVNKQGQVVVDFIYGYAANFSGGLAYVFGSNDFKYKYIDKSGNVIWSAP